MSCEVRLPGESFPTFLTFKRLLGFMDYLVSGEVCFEIESLLALSALIGPLPSVSRLVLHQLRLPREGFPALVTLIGPLTCVGFLMLREV